MIWECETKKKKLNGKHLQVRLCYFPNRENNIFKNELPE